MTSSIGRVGRGSILLDCISTASLTGRQVEFTGALHATVPSTLPTATQIAALKAERQRLAGYQGNFDEPVVPIIWDLDPALNGFYRIGSVSVNVDAGSLKRGVFPFTLSAEQVVGYAAPQFEAVITGSSITNAHGITGTAWFTFPDDVTEQFFSHQCTINETRTSETGVLNFTDCNTRYTGSLKYYLRPSNFYVGTCSLEVGDPLEVVVGSQISDSPYDWRISNGLVRVTASDFTPGRLYVSHYDGTQWEVAKTYTIAGDEPVVLGSSPAIVGEAIGFETVTVLRNSPETVAIRLSVAWEYGLEAGRTFLDISLRRGDRTAVLYLITHPDYPLNAWKVRRSAVEASVLVAGGGGIRASANDASGNRYVLTTPVAFTPNHTTGELAITADAATAMFGISMEIGGSSASGTATAAELIEQFLGGQSERLVVAAR